MIQTTTRLNSGCDPFPRPWSVVSSNLARIVLKRQLELAWFCQLYLIAAALTRTLLALIAADECEHGSLDPKLSYLQRRCVKPGLSRGPTKCPVWIELDVPGTPSANGVAHTLPDSAQILNRDAGCRRGGDGCRRRRNWRRSGGWRRWRRWVWCCCGRNTPNHKTDNACSYPND
jgi:hypothetical protein